MRKLFAAGCLLAIVLSAPAHAQIAEGLSGSPGIEYLRGQTAWDELSEFGTCYASQQRGQALQLVSTRPDSIEEVKVYKRLFQKPYLSCLAATEYRVAHQLVRGVIAQGLYRKAIPVPPELVIANAPTSENVRNFMDAAVCFAADHRDSVRTLLATKLGSKQEEESLEAIWPMLRECIPSGARSIKVSNVLVRLRLAEAMWRLGETPQGHAAS